jgi:phosphoketolase
LILTAIGAYQLEEVLKTSARLAERTIPHAVIYMLEPGRFRYPRSDGERDHVVPESRRSALYPEATLWRLFVTHTRPEPLAGVLQPLHTGHGQTSCLGFLGQGGTLTVAGMLFVNRSSWVHILDDAARLLGLPRQDVLTEDELAALDGQASPHGVII